MNFMLLVFLVKIQIYTGIYLHTYIYTYIPSSITWSHKIPGIWMPVECESFSWVWCECDVFLTYGALKMIFYTYFKYKSCNGLARFWDYLTLWLHVYDLTDWDYSTAIYMRLVSWKMLLCFQNIKTGSFYTRLCM